SQLDSGVWHLLIGDKASGLGEALGRLVSGHEVGARVETCRDCFGLFASKPAPTFNCVHKSKLWELACLR
ncbi:hypothetical protein, partial [Klebsiella quasipneumoniae]|uniref:hypothetical protein n=1 Tax=Klebsiella quasipneumoniae TaxID=1463165 RepID=UPI0027311525